MFLILISIAIGYLLGAIPFGYIIGRLNGIDLTKEGSGSTGATNVLRMIGKKEAAFVLAADFFKGYFAPALAVYAAARLNLLSEDCNILTLAATAMVFAAAGAILGHCRSIWIGFKGGKAVAAGVGTLFGLNFYVGLIVALIWISTVFITRYSSLGALIAIPSSPIIMYFLRSYSPTGQNLCPQTTAALVAYCLLGAIYIVWKHKTNIQRLIKGEEPKVSFKK